MAVVSSMGAMRGWQGTRNAIAVMLSAVDTVLLILLHEGRHV